MGQRAVLTENMWVREQLFSDSNGTYLSLSLRAIHPAARSPIEEEHRHPGAGRDPDFNSVGFVLWMPAYAGMTNRKRPTDSSSSRAQRSNLTNQSQSHGDCFVASLLAMTADFGLSKHHFSLTPVFAFYAQ
jgi:hypothetical protein